MAERPPGSAELVLVENDEDDIFLTRMMFRRSPLAQPLSLTVYQSGAEALEDLGARLAAGMTAPDLVLVDLNLPRMGGIETIRALRHTAGLGQLTMGICTGSSDAAEREAALAAGADFFIEKPFRPSGLAEIARQSRRPMPLTLRCA